MTNPTVRISLRAQSIASALADLLEEIAGQPTAFVLVMSTDKTAQYISNASRADGVALIEDLLARWKANRADIPAHFNPDLTRDA